MHVLKIILMLFLAVSLLWIMRAFPLLSVNCVASRRVHSLYRLLTYKRTIRARLYLHNFVQIQAKARVSYLFASVSITQIKSMYKIQFIRYEWSARWSVIFLFACTGWSWRWILKAKKKDIGKSSPVDDCTAAFTKAI